MAKRRSSLNFTNNKGQDARAIIIKAQSKLELDKSNVFLKS